MSSDKDWVQELVGIMAKLRAPDGCPWDREQDHKSLKPYLIEEASEVLDAIDEEDMELLEEELGDVLMNVVFHAQLATEKDIFNFQDVAKNISEKMIRRHPHVFADSDASSSEDVERQWEEIKKQEKQERTSILDGIPRSMPGLMRAHKIQKKVAKVGFDWPNEEGPLDKIDEETTELKEALESGDQAHIKEEFGDLLFSLVNLARHLGFDANEALTESNDKFTNRFKKLEVHCKQESMNLDEMTLEEMDAVWDKVKKQ
ncbi:MAG: nucleoside triphosphate pyrophosphohydrolase [Lentisphaeraceae bacterium]|nr:nucleoside triphosphate pyrophosphohydrolase [Lentisphaeraceae bacterium]